MKEFLILVCLMCILRSEAIPFSRIANGKVATDDLHACMVLVIRPEQLGTDLATLGSGSIISTRHVLTSAHLASGIGNTFQINFFVLTSRRSFQSKFALVHESFDEATYVNDIALIFLQGNNFFSTLNIIRVSMANVEAGVTGTVTGYGFTSKQTMGMASLQPMSVNQTVTIACDFKNYEAATSHFCAIDQVTLGIVCPGDNGAGLYVKNTSSGENELIGVVSRIIKGCSKADYTAYTRLSLFSTWINAITNM
ncbi:Serine protease filzig [Pseudolycoriella hygida]|uniref:Serine protease filzig n=1 Tax=Pseudolycoriella hygida TaxID=35572 RepID=A0A9Q0N4P7_9DIPT|nr:Serine protease filzig [Pseudolycoriella hygida]